MYFNLSKTLPPEANENKKLIKKKTKKQKKKQKNKKQE